MHFREEPVLLPAPRHLDLTGGSVDIGVKPIVVSGVESGVLEGLSGAPPFYSPPGNRGGESFELSPRNRGEIGDTVRIGCHFRKNISFGNEGYRLVISPPESNSEPVVSIEAAAEDGIRHGLRTVSQLLLQYGRELPCMIIEDSPSFPVRGVMLDISRDRVPTMPELFKTVDLLSAWKINHIQLYTEHTFAYKGHEPVWENCSPVTPDEVRRLDQFCRNRGVTLAANQNCFGHMHRWLMHEPYAHLAETHGRWNFNGNQRSGPFSLCPVDPGSISLVRDLLDQLLPCFTGGLVNIGCDETHDVGKGRSRAAVEKSGYSRVYADFVRRVSDIAEKHGFRSMFWADIVLNHPEALDYLPGDMIALCWGYEPDTPFDKWCRVLSFAGFRFWVCPGTSSWRSITGRTSERRDNIRAAAEQGLAGGAEGFMITDWGDMGHRQQLPISLHGLAEAANCAWNAETAGLFDARASSLFAFDDVTGQVGRWLDELGDVDLELRRIGGKPDVDGNPTPLRNASCLFNDLHTPLDQPWNVTDITAWERVREKLSDLEARFPTGIDVQIYDELHHVVDVAKFAADRAVARRTESGLTGKVRNNLAGQLGCIIEEHRRLWLMRSRTGGLEESCRYYMEVLGLIHK